MKKALKSLWHGIKAVCTVLVDWATTLFGMNDNSRFCRVMRRIVATSFAVLMAVIAILFLSLMIEYLGDRARSLGLVKKSCDDSSCYLERLSENVLYHNCSGGYGYLTNNDGKKILKNVSWYAMPYVGDSLACYSDGELRGYFNIRDGRLVVKPVYDHAWIFSEDLAAVDDKGCIKFINAKGEVVINKGFAYNATDDDYLFHHGHCAVRDSSSMYMGFIDCNGEWVLPPVYDCIAMRDSLWDVTNGNRRTFLTLGMDTVMSLANVSDVSFSDTTILVTFIDHTQSMYGKDGTLIADSQIGDIKQMLYDTRELENNTRYDYEEAIAVATCLRYEAETSWYGLMSPDGRIVTPPSYVSIEAIGQDLYLCETTLGRGVILNSKGVRVK